MVATAGIIIIGDEILSGRTKDSNINWIASQLDGLGVRLKEARIIPDDSDNIITTNISQDDLISNIKRRTQKHITSHKNKMDKGYQSWQPK